MLGLIILIFVTIASGMFAKYLSSDYEASFTYLYTYFFGTLFVMGFFLLSFVSLAVYSYALKESKKSTPMEIVSAKVVLVIVSIISVIYISSFFGLDIGFVTVQNMMEST